MPSKKRKIRRWRKGIKRVQNGDESTHVMTTSSGPKKTQVYPTLFPKKKNPSTDPKDWEEKPSGEKGNWQAYKEAKKRGEVVNFRSNKRAKRFAAGAWKKGKDKREAMRAYYKKNRGSKSDMPGDKRARGGKNK